MTNPGQAGYGKAQTKAFYKDVRDRVDRMPGVESVSWASNLPLWARSREWTPSGRPRSSDRRPRKSGPIVNTVDLGYFETAGRRDRARARVYRIGPGDTSVPVAIVNEKMAQDYWPGGDALGEAHSTARRKAACGRSWGSPEPPTTPLGRSRRNLASMCLWNRTIPTP